MENEWEEEEDEDTFGICPTMKQQLIDMAMDEIHGELTIPTRNQNERMEKESYCITLLREYFLEKDC